MTSYMPTHVFMELQNAEKQARFWSSQGEYRWGSQWQEYANSIRRGYDWYARQIGSAEYKRRNGEEFSMPQPPQIPKHRPQNPGKDQMNDPQKVKDPRYQGVSTSGGSGSGSRNRQLTKPMRDYDLETLANLARIRAASAPTKQHM